MRIDHLAIERFVTAIFTAAGCEPAEAGRIAGHLVEANLAGHDSHGVIRVSAYIDWLRQGAVLPNRRMRIVHETSVLAVVDGDQGFGQSIGVESTALGVEKAKREGIAVVALRNSGHLGRIGAWPLQAAQAGCASVHFVSTSGGGILVAPFGGRSRRLSADPIAAGIPRPHGPPVILDMSCCTIAEGKLKVALNKGTTVPEGCIIDSAGRPAARKGTMQLLAYDLAPDGSARFRKVLMDYAPQDGPDGIICDTEGNLYVACRDVTRPGIRVYDSEGKEIAEIPTELPTNAGFGRGAVSNMLYVTAGKSLYRIRLNRHGHHPSKPTAAEASR